MHFQEMANQFPDALTNTKRVTKSYIPVVNFLAQIEIPYGQSDDKVTPGSKTHMKYGRPYGSKDKNPRNMVKQMNM